MAKRKPFAPPFEVRAFGPATLVRGDCREVLAWYSSGIDQGQLEPAHACVTDPPYEIGFMGRAWDRSGVATDPRTWGWVLDVLRPGAHLLAFGGARTYHRIASAIEDADFEIRDQLMWLYGTGQPHGLDIAKAIDATDAKPDDHSDALAFTHWLRSTGISAKAINAATRSFMASHYLTAGSQPAIPTAEHFEKIAPLVGEIPHWVEQLVHDRDVRQRMKAANLARRRVVGKHKDTSMPGGFVGRRFTHVNRDITTAHLDEARQWEGWNTALKPAHEPIAMARKPFRGSGAGNVLAHGTGAINVDACRCEGQGADPGNKGSLGVNTSVSCYGKRLRVPYDGSKGRWPANVITDGSLEVLGHFPESAREAIRFFYSAKASKADREFGVGIGHNSRHAAPGKRANIHPTVKPVDLMAWLCRLVTPAGGLVLDPFMGSGSTGIAAVRHGFRFLGVEQDAEYYEIACKRVAAAVAQEEAMPTLERVIADAVRAHQLSMFEDVTAA